jgi:hypothetical protein
MYAHECNFPPFTETRFQEKSHFLIHIIILCYIRVGANFCILIIAAYAFSRAHSLLLFLAATATIVAGRMQCFTQMIDRLFPKSRPFKVAEPWNVTRFGSNAAVLWAWVAVAVLQEDVPREVNRSYPHHRLSSLNHHSHHYYKYCPLTVGRFLYQFVF